MSGKIKSRKVERNLKSENKYENMSESDML